MFFCTSLHRNKAVFLICFVSRRAAQITEGRKAHTKQTYFVGTKQEEGRIISMETSVIWITTPNRCYIMFKLCFVVAFTERTVMVY